MNFFNIFCTKFQLMMQFLSSTNPSYLFKICTSSFKTVPVFCFSLMIPKILIQNRVKIALYTTQSICPSIFYFSSICLFSAKYFNSESINYWRYSTDSSFNFFDYMQLLVRRCFWMLYQLNVQLFRSKLFSRVMYTQPIIKDRIYMGSIVDLSSFNIDLFVLVVTVFP